MRFEADTGEVCEFDPETFTSLDCTQLFAAIRGGNEFSFKIHVVNIKIAIGDEESVSHSSGEVKITINFPHPPKIFALTEGGWLPAPFISPYNLLADRNVISYLKDLIAGKEKPADLKNWLELLRNSSFYINPLPAAFEGNTKTFPTLEEFTQNYKEAVATLRSFHQDFKVVEYAEEIYPQVYRILTLIIERYAAATEFLKRVAPLLAAARARRDYQRIEDQIFTSAREADLPSKSFPMIAALSCLYEKPNSYKAARLLLKPKNGYTDKDAYNALADLRMLEIFAASLGFIGENKYGLTPFALGTGDQALAVFGCGLDIHDVTVDANGANINFSITETLFPALSEEERERLLLRINNPH